jgi:hypothetical protein
MDFFSGTTPEHEDDIFAEDYMGRPEEWAKPNWSDTAKVARGRVNKEVGHLTAVRKNQGDPAKSWDPEIAALIPEMLAVTEDFLRLADSAKIAPEVRDSVPMRRAAEVVDARP